MRGVGKGGDEKGEKNSTLKGVISRANVFIQRKGAGGGAV